MVQEEGLVEGTFLFNSAGDRSEEASRFSDLFHGEKLHMILDSVNSEHTCLFAMNVLHKGGVLISLGLHGGSCELALPMLPLNAYTICGAHGGSLSELEELIELVERHSTIQMQVREYPFSDANNALCDLMSGLIPGRGVLVL